MTNERFAEEIIALTDTLYRVSYSILRDRYDREDAVQSCLEKAWKKRRTLRDERYLKTWLIRILINECYNVHRHKRELPQEIPEQAAPPGADPNLHDEFMCLPEEVRTPIVLHYPLYGRIFHTRNCPGPAHCARNRQIPHAKWPGKTERIVV